MSVPTEPGAIRRRAARVLLLDGADRLLLFHGFDPGEPAESRFWFTVGGGLDPGESVREAAARELREETGLVGVEIGPPVWVRNFAFRFEGVRYQQQEYFHVARVAEATVDTGGFDEIERRSVLGHRWWTAAELVATTERIHPADLPELLAALLGGALPDPPRELSR